MDRRVQWALVSVLVIALACVAVVTRYEYPARDAGRFRIDRWTGTPEAWDCKDLSAGRAALAGFRKKFPKPEAIPNPELARAVREEHPEYPRMPDAVLARLVLDKYPEYEDILRQIATRQPGEEYRCGWKPRPQ